MSALLPTVGPKPAPGIRRLPLTNTKVRCEPKPRRLTVAVPLELMEVPELCSAMTCGKLFSRSSVRTNPVCWMSRLVRLVTGLMDTSFGN